jgi:hypothetical protein
MAKPKLALIPSTVGGSVYSVLPSNGDGDFNFSRASAATRINAQGLIETVAVGDNRLNYPLLDGTVQTCPHLLLEPQRTNVVPYSQTLSNWGQTNVVSTDNAIISPDGTLNASKITDDSVNSTHRIILSSTTSASGEATYSVFLKKGTMTTCFVNLFSGATIANASVDLENGTISGATGTNHKIEQYPNDWYRVSIQGTLANTSTFVYVYVKQLAGYIGNGDYIYAWGAQLEEASYPTSYIVSNSGSATTRLAEVCDGSGNASTFNDSEGVLMAQVSTISTNENSCISINDSSLVNRVELLWFSDGKLYTQVGNSGQTAIDSNTLMNKISVRWNSGTYYLWVNGFSIFSDTYTSLSGLNSLDFLRQGSYTFKGKTKQIQVFDSALTDSELETLTSWMSFSDMAIDLNYTIQ